MSGRRLGADPNDQAEGQKLINDQSEVNSNGHIFDLFYGFSLT